MALNKDEVYKLIIEIVSRNQCDDSTLEESHIAREYSLEKISSNEYHLKIIRHPHLFGRESKGQLSSGFVSLQKTYKLNITDKTLKLINEDVVDRSLSYPALAQEDALRNMDWIGPEIEPDLMNIDTEEKVEAFAEIYLNNIDLIAGYVTDYEKYLPPDFWQNLKAALIDEYKDKFIEAWRSLRSE